MSGNLSGTEFLRLAMEVGKIKRENERLKKENQVLFLQSSTWIDKSITASVENKQLKESLKSYARLMSELIKALDMIDYTMECESLINKAKEMSNNA